MVKMWSLQSVSWARWLSVALAIALASPACRSTAAPVSTSRVTTTPIVVSEPDDLQPAAEECQRLVAALRSYAACPRLTNAQRQDAQEEADAAATDFTPASSSKLDAASKATIAVECRKASMAAQVRADDCTGG
jgi:hypothetical protein